MSTNHRYFIQYMLKKGFTTVEDAQKFCRYISKGEIDNSTQFRTLIIEINREISKQYYKLVFNTCEVTNEELIVWLNTKNDEISKFQITFNPLELEYFHAILQEILNAEDHRITFIVCINITSTLTAFFSRDNGQKVLGKWLKGGYFVNKDAYIHLGPRLILEFTSYLKTHYPNSVCNLCSELVFTGKQCDSCNIPLHSYCLSKYLKNQNNCPSCHQIWNESENGINGEESNTLENNVEHMDINGEEPPSPVLEQRHRRANRHHSNIEEDYSEEAGPSTRKRHR